MSTCCLQRAWESTTLSIQELANTVANTTIHAIQSTHHWIDQQYPSYSDTIERIREVGEQILLTAGKLILFAAQSAMFSIGVIVSAMNPQFMKGSIDRISSLWRRQNLFQQGLIVAGAAVAWPISLAAASFFVGGSIGLSLLGETQETLHQD